MYHSIKTPTDIDESRSTSFVDSIIFILSSQSISQLCTHHEVRLQLCTTTKMRFFSQNLLTHLFVLVAFLCYRSFRKLALQKMNAFNETWHDPNLGC